MNSAENGNNQDKKTLWIGDIEAWMDEQYLSSLFGKSASIISVKIIRDKQTNLPVGYGFIEFTTHEVAAKVLKLFNGSTNPRTNKPFRLNWGVHGASRRDRNNDHRGGAGGGRHGAVSTWENRTDADVNEENPISVGVI
jgi:RNA recognition motif-containing protein